jgi:hypothetical protein
LATTFHLRDSLPRFRVEQRHKVLKETCLVQAPQAAAQFPTNSPLAVIRLNADSLGRSVMVAILAAPKQRHQILERIGFAGQFLPRLRQRRGCCSQVMRGDGFSPNPTSARSGLHPRFTRSHITLTETPKP